jgi:hypothetical protein
MLYLTVAPATVGGVIDVPLISEYSSACPGTLVTNTYVLTPGVAFQLSVSPETLSSGAACGLGAVSCAGGLVGSLGAGGLAGSLGGGVLTGAPAAG